MEIFKENYFCIGVSVGLLLGLGGLFVCAKGLVQEGDTKANQRLETAEEVRDKEGGILRDVEDALGIERLFEEAVARNPDQRSEDGRPNRVERDEGNEQIWRRVHQEEALSAEVIRQCPNCWVAIVRESGCNLVTCEMCYAKMCYVCKKQIQGYSHFR